MALKDRFFTPTTARAILSWRILLGIGAGVVLAVAGAGLPWAVAVGAGLYAGSVAAAMPRPAKRVAIDPFTLSEPWRQIMQGAQGAGRRLRQTVETASDGPLKETMRAIADQLERGLAEAWEIARRGDEIDDSVRRLDPTALRSRLSTLERRADADHQTIEAIDSVKRQIATADRLKAQSEETARTLRLAQTRLDELVAQASEMRYGTVDTSAYRREVDDLVIRLEALHQAVEETRPS